MRYAINRTDGGVSIMGIPPIALVVKSTGARFADLYMAGGKLTGARAIPKAELAKRPRGTPSLEEITVTLPVEMADLEPDSIDGVVLEFPSPESCIAQRTPEFQASVISIHHIDPQSIPEDRTFRNALSCDGGKLQHDMQKAREIHRDNLRRERAPLLAALDVEYQRADEAEDVGAKKEVAAKKKALRDVTKDPRIAEAKTCDELKAVWPECLSPQG